MSSDPSSSSPPPSLPDATNETSTALADCLLSQYRFSAAGIGLGTAYSLKYKKGFIPMIAAGAVGTSVDMVYGFLVECAPFRTNDNNNNNNNNNASTLSSPTTSSSQDK